VRADHEYTMQTREAICQAFRQTESIVCEDEFLPLCGFPDTEEVVVRLTLIRDSGVEFEIRWYM
jgi:hypothetical protein